ncbi:aminotransferase [Pseudaestuariivita sp.]|uniref:aminotransferase n=1 Tax=Pseudaestuariivita sp. TaxID=2211669 RepID=UPI00405982E9
MSNLATTIAAHDKRHALRPWTNFEAFEADPQLVITQGEGAWLEDIEGKSYLDAVGGLWCTNIGLGREEMADAIADQVRQLAFSSTFVDMTNTPAALLAAKIAEKAPGDLNRVHFTTGGSTAVDSAYRMVQFYQSSMGRPEKCHVIARDNGYHGSTFASMSIGNKPGDRAPEFHYLSETIHHISAPYPYRVGAGMDEAAFTQWLVDEFEAKIAEVGADKVGAFFAEPIMGAGGVIVPPEGYLKAMWEVCQRHDILFVADEVVTAWGRLGHWFASLDEFGVQPDIICSAKGLSSGYLPIGAMIYSDRIHDAISADTSRWYTSGFTYSGHPVCCAAALKNIEIMEREDLLTHVNEVGPYFEAQLATLADLPTVGEVRGRKLMMCIENVADKASRTLHPDEVNIGKRISDKAEELGLIVRPIGPLNIMSPPLIITRADVDTIVDRLGRAIEMVHRDLAQ